MAFRRRMRAKRKGGRAAPDPVVVFSCPHCGAHEALLYLREVYYYEREVTRWTAEGTFADGADLYEMDEDAILVPHVKNPRRAGVALKYNPDHDLVCDGCGNTFPNAVPRPEVGNTCTKHQNSFGWDECNEEWLDQHDNRPCAVDQTKAALGYDLETMQRRFANDPIYQHVSQT